MNLYHLSQSQNRGYDTHDSVIVAAKTEDEARKINPSSFGWDEHGYFTSWCRKPEDVEVELIGKAKPGTQAGIILASFNAG